MDAERERDLRNKVNEVEVELSRLRVDLYSEAQGASNQGTDIAPEVLAQYASRLEHVQALLVEVKVILQWRG